MASIENNNDDNAASSPDTAYNDLRRLIPSLAAELDHLRASLREHNLWLQRYGHGNGQDDDEALAAVPAGLPTLRTGPPPAAAAAAASETPPPISTPTSAPPPTSAAPPPPIDQPPQSDQPLPPPSSSTAEDLLLPPSSEVPSYDASSITDATPPPYAASEVPLYSSAVRDDVMQRRDQLMEWLREGEDVLRDYSARLTQLATELHLPAGDALGTWNEAAPDNALPSYTAIEGREELMVGGVGEVPPVYARGTAVEQ